MRRVVEWRSSLSRTIGGSLFGSLAYAAYVLANLFFDYCLLRPHTPIPVLNKFFVARGSSGQHLELTSGIDARQVPIRNGAVRGFVLPAG
jgi:hypothetical protein